MGVHLNGWLEKDKKKIVNSEYIVDIQNYALFGFLADIRNHAKLPTLPADPRSHYCEKNEEYINVLKTSQLLDFDYDQSVEDRSNGFRGSFPEGGGAMTTYRELFGEEYFEMLNSIRESEADTIYFVID